MAKVRRKWGTWCTFAVLATAMLLLALWMSLFARRPCVSRCCARLPRSSASSSCRRSPATACLGASLLTAGGVPVSCTGDLPTALALVRPAGR